VTTLAVLNIVFGSLGLIFGACGLLSMLVADSVTVASTGQPRVSVFRDMVEYVEREGPGYGAITLVQAVYGMVMAVVLLASGIGLLKFQPWARLTAIGYAALNIVVAILDLIFKLVFVLPVMARWQADFESRYPIPGVVNNPFNSPAFQQGGAVF